MTLSEINNNIFSEDIMIAAVTHEASEDYVRRILNPDLKYGRAAKSDMAKAIIKTLRRLARVNINSKSRKENIAGVTIK